MTPTTLHDRLLRSEARIAMLEDRVAYYRAQLRDWGHVLVVAGELVILWAVVTIIERWGSE